MKYLIVNADDFGASTGINRGIIEAHQHGIVTSTSLMVYGPACEDAVSLARRVPDLSVGLHLELSGDGEQLGVERADLERCRTSVYRQLHRFKALMRRLPTHLDSHHDAHREPRLLPLIRKVACDYALPLRGCSAIQHVAKFYGQWDGDTHFEQISVHGLRQLLDSEMEHTFTEISCHPGYIGPGLRSSYTIEREAELRTLCDPRVPVMLRERNIEMIGFREASDLVRNVHA